jgi:hypothetical protein
MTLQALSGVIALRLVSREGSPSLLEVRHTHTHRCQQGYLLLMRLKDFNKTKRTRHCPWCGDDAYALGWVVIKPQAMVGAKSTRHNDENGHPQYLCCGRGFWTWYDST